MRYDLLHPKALRAALIEHMGPDYPVPKERQVRRWVTGDTPIPGWARRAVDELHGITKETAPPSLEERLRRIELYVEAIAGATPGVDAEQIADIHRRVLELERARQQHDEPRRSAGLDAQDEPSGTAR